MPRSAFAKNNIAVFIMYTLVEERHISFHNFRMKVLLQKLPMDFFIPQNYLERQIKDLELR